MAKAKAASADTKGPSSVKDEQPAENIVQSLLQKTDPPPEKKAAIWTRRQVVLSFWVIVIFLGFPIWWKTTRIYRASLPLQLMTDWADGKACKPEFPLLIALEAPALLPQDAQNLLRTTQHALDDLNDFSAHHLRLIVAESSSSQNGSVDAKPDESYTEPSSNNLQSKDEVTLSVRLIPGESGSLPQAQLQAYQPTLDVFYAPNQIPSSSSTSSPLATFIANELRGFFSEEQALLAFLLSSSSSSSGSSKKPLAPEVTASLSRRMTRSFKYAPTYHLTFSLFTPVATPSDWDIEGALEEYIAPLLESLSSISNFTVDSQVQLYATFSPMIRQPEFDAGRKAWTLRKDDLSGFINAAEWPLSPSIGAGPTINFILYVPDANQTPLVIKENGGNSWLIPQWGGALILNLPSSTPGKPPVIPSKLTKDALRPAMLTFSGQLLALLGLPQSPQSLPLRISTLTRVRAASLIFSASSTLGALARLTQALPSISIPNSVADSVGETIAHLQAACMDLREGRFRSALERARGAETEAEKAFFERSMVGQVYFPDEHKVAVYLPLLGPVAVPLIMTTLKELKKIVQARKAGTT